MRLSSGKTFKTVDKPLIIGYTVAWQNTKSSAKQTSSHVLRERRRVVQAVRYRERGPTSSVHLGRAKALRCEEYRRNPGVSGI